MSIFTDDTRKELKFFKNGTVDITSKVVYGSFSCENKLSTEQLNYGETNAARVQFQTTEDLNLTGNKVVVKFGAGSTFVVVGTFKITYSSKKVNSSVITCTAYDCVKDFDVNVADWYEGLTFPLTLRAMRNSLCEYIGITQVNKTLVNDTELIAKTISPSKLNARDVLYYIAQLNGVFPHDSGNYTLDWVSLGTSSIEVDSTLLLDPLGFEKKTYQTADIGGILIRSEDGDAGYSYGSTTNQFIISANPLTYGLGETQLARMCESLYNKIKDDKYTPCTIELKYVPDHVLGAKLEYDSNVFYVLGRKLKGCLNDSIECDGNEYLEEEDSLTTEIEQLRGMSNVIKNDLEGTNQRITNVQDGLETEIAATASGLRVEIKNIQDQIDGDVNTYHVHEEPTLANYPAYDFTYNLKCDGSITIGDGVGFEYKDEYYKLNNGSIAYYEEEYMSYRLQKDYDSNTWYWKSLADSDFGIAMSKISQLEVKTDGISAEVSSNTTKITKNSSDITDLDTKITQTEESITASVSATYETKASASETKTELQSAITASASEITSTVSATYETKTAASETKSVLQSQITQNATSITSKVSKGDIASTINQTAQSVLIQANKINLAGYITATNLATGGQTTINGSNITTGTISASRLDSSVITTNNISAQTISGNKVSGGTISSSDISLGTSGKVYGGGMKIQFGNFTWGDTTISNALAISTTSNSHDFLINDNLADFFVPVYVNGNVFLGTGNKLSLVGYASKAYSRTNLLGGYASAERNIRLPNTAGTLALQSSDKRIKDNIKDTEVNALDYIGKIKLHEFDYTDGRVNSHWSCGMIAQEMEELDPNTIVEGSGGEFEDGTVDPLCIDNFYLTGYLIKAIQELTEKVNALEEGAKDGKTINGSSKRS